jgi:hypothetical protein
MTPESTASEPSRLQRALLHVALVVLPVLAYAPGLTSPRTLYDDPLYLDRAEYTMPGASGLWSLWVGERAWHGQFLEYFPLRDSVYWLIFQRWQNWTVPYHVTSLFFHVVATLLVFRLVEKLSRTFWVAAAAGLLFAVHPIHIESVVWIAGLKDPMYTCFSLGSLLMYWNYREGKRPRDYAFSLLLLICALLCKSMAISTPVIMLAIELWVGPRARWKSVAERLSGPVLVTGMFFAQFLLIGKLNSVGSMPHQGNWVAHWVLTAWAQVAYVRQVIFPAEFRLIYCFWPVESLLDLRFLAGVGLLVVIGAVAYVWRSKPLRLFCLAFYFACLLPVSNLIPFPAVMADRYLYAASVGSCFLLALLLDSARPRLKNTVLGLAVAALTLTTASRSYVWQDEEGLWAEGDEDPACLKDPEFPASQVHFLRYYTVKDPTIKLQALDRLLQNPGLKGDSHGLQCEALLTGARLLRAAGQNVEAERRAQAAVKTCWRHPKMWETVLTVTLHRNLPVAETAARKWSRVEPTPQTHLLRVLTKLEVNDEPALREEALQMVRSSPEGTCTTLRQWSQGLRPELQSAMSEARSLCP